jgi:hypothetical protein
MALNLGPLNVLLNLKGARRFNQDAEKATSSVNNIVGSIKNLAGAYATMETAKKAFDLSQEAAAFADAAAIFRHSGGNLDALRQSVRGTVSDFELVKKANLAKTMGIPSEAMGTLAQAAMAASKATGESVDFMLDSIVRGVARGSPLILDNLGIIISIEEANAAYAKTLGKTTGELTKNEQAQAVLKATLAAVGPQIKNAADAGANAAEVYAQLTASLQNLTVLLGQSLSPAVSWFTKQLVQAIEFYQEFLSQGDTSDSAERAMDAIADKTRIVSDQLKKARQQLKGFQEAQLTGTVPEHIRTVLPGLRGLSEEAALGALEMQIDDLQEKLAKLSAQARGVGVSRIGAVMAPMAPTAPTTGGGAPVAQAAQAIEATVTSRLVGVMDVGADMMQAEFDDLMNSFGFANEVIIEHGDAIAKANEHVLEFQRRMEDVTYEIAHAVREIGSGVLSGIRGDSLGATFGPQLGQTIGGALAGPVGAAVGTVVGEAFGPLLDVVTRTTNIFGPVVDGLNQLGVALFAPLVVAMGPTFERLGTFMAVVLVPIFESLGYVIGTVQWLFEEMWTAGQNFAIWLQNLTRDDQNKIPYLAGKSFEQFMDEVDEARRLALEALNDQTYEAAERFRELNEELTNIPMGVKRLRALQFNATRGSVAFPGRFNAPAFGA